MLNVPFHWRIPPSSQDKSPFAAGEHGRPLRIIIDAESAAAGPASELLWAFARRALAEIYSTEPGVERRVELGPIDEAHDLLPVRYVLPTGTREVALGAAASWLRHARVTARELARDEQEVWRVLVLAQAVQRHQLDALVSGSPVLTSGMWNSHARSAGVSDARGACALLGLYLRAHNDFTVHQEGNSGTSLRPEHFYRGAAVAALPGYADWMHAALTAWRDSQTPELFGLLRGVETRLGRALIARDYFSVRIRHWRPDETWDEAVYFFESALLSLNGALDAAARFCHLVYGVAGVRNGAGFGRKRWRKELLACAPELLGLLEPGGNLRAVTELIALLRNFIHGEAPSHELHGYEGGPGTTDYGAGALALDADIGGRLLAASTAVGGAERWGLKQSHDGVVLVQPAQYLPMVLQETLSALRDLMAAVDLDRLITGRAEAFEPSCWLRGHNFASELLLLAGLSDGRDAACMGP